MQKFRYIHPFIYDDEKIKDINLEKLDYIDSFLIYLDKLFIDECKKDGVKKLDVSNFYNFNKTPFCITDLKKNLFEFKFENIEIYFFPHNIAFLVLEVDLLNNLDINKMYEFNKMFTGLYKKGQNSVYIGKNKINNKINEKLYKIDNAIFTKKQSKNLNEILFSANYLFKKKNSLFIRKYNFTLKGINEFFEKYDYENKYDLKQRTGLLETEKYLLTNKTFQDFQDLHFAKFDVILEIFKENPFRIVHFDTFITSLFIRFVKLNKSIEYYDNFNPLNTNYMNVYTVFKENDLKKVYQENFAKYEPFINNKDKKGTILENDFFKIFQAQADWFIIANSNNLVHIVKDDIYNNVKHPINHQRFLTFLFTTFQYVYLSMLESKIIVSNSKNLLKQISFVNNSLNEYLEFLNNYYFSDISDEPALNEYYHFLKDTKNLEEKFNHIKNISIYNRSLKEIFNNIVNNKLLLLLIIIITPLIFNLLNVFSSKIISLLNDFIFNSNYLPINIVVIEFLLLPLLLPLMIVISKEIKEYLEKQKCEKNKLKKFYKKT